MAMRNRAENTFGNTWITTTSPNGAISTTLSLGQRSVFQRYSVGTKVGDYSAPNAHQYVIAHYINWNGFTLETSPVTAKSVLTRGLLSRTLADTLPLPLIMPTSLYNKAYAEMVEKIRGSVDISIDLIQWRQTVQMVRLYRRGISGFVEAVNRTIRSIDMFHAEARRREKLATRSGAWFLRYRKYEKWYRYNLRKIAKDAAQARLEYVYGWKPLASSIIGLSEVLSQPDGLEKKIKAKSKERVRNVVRVTQSKKAEVRAETTNYRCSIQLTVGPIPQVISNLARISSLNPASIAYEAFPFSFVADWFLNIGGWLRNVETAYVYGSSFRSGFYNFGYIARSDQSDNYSDSSYVVNARAFTMRKFFVRVPLVAFPFPRFPSVEMDLGIGRSLNALSLAVANASRIDDFIRVVLKK